MPTVAEVLKQSGWTDEEIAALDAKKTEGFTKILSTADELKAEAERKQRATEAMIQNEVNPSLDKWASESANKDAEIAYYKTLAEKAKEGGFVETVPPFTPPNPGAVQSRTADGKFVAGGNAVPGSPQYMTPQQALAVASHTAWAISEHIRLHGSPLPDDIETLAKEADQNHMKFRDYVTQKYGFDKKREEIQATKQKEHDDAIRKETETKIRQEFAERGGNNPAIRPAVDSRFSQMNKAVTDKVRPDPLTMTREQRHASTSQVIQKEIAEQVQ